MNVDGTWMLFTDSRGRRSLVIEDEETVSGAVNAGALQVHRGGPIPLVCTLTPLSYGQLLKEEWPWKTQAGGRPLEIATCVGIVCVEMQP